MPRPKTSQAPPTECLTAAWVTKAKEQELLARLVQTATALEALQPVQGGHAFATDFLAALVAPHLLEHSAVDVQLAACCACAAASRAAAKGVGPLNAVVPFAKAAHKGLSEALLRNLGRLRVEKKKGKKGKKKADDSDDDEDAAAAAEARPKLAAAQLRFMQRLLSSLTQGHVLCSLFDAQPPEDEVLEGLVETLVFHAPAGADEAMLSALANAVGDCIASCGAASDAHMELLMSALVLKGPHPSACRVALAVLRRQEDLLQGPVSDFITGGFERNVEELRRCDVAGAEAAERKAVLKALGNSCDLIADIAAASVNVATQAIPNLAAAMMNCDVPEGRVQVVRSLGRAFLASPLVLAEYDKTLSVTVGRLNDTHRTVRLQALSLATELLAKYQDNAALWSSYPLAVAQRLNDNEESVRKAAVVAVAGLCTAVPHKIPPRLADAMAQRCIDKRPAVRRAAVEQAARLYRTVHASAPAAAPRVSWVPNAVLRGLQVDPAGLGPVVEAAVTAMLPAPAGALVQPSLAATTTAAKKKAGKAAKGKEEAAATAKTDPFATAFVTLCGDLDDDNWPLFLTFLKKKQQLRLAVRRLFEMRNAVKALDQQQRAPLVENITRLLQFLQTATYAQGDEWDVLFKMKDEKAVKAVLALCAEDCADFNAARSDAASRVKACVGKTTGQFAEVLMLPQLALPFAPRHIEAVAQEAEAARETAAEDGRLRAAMRALEGVGCFAPVLLDPVMPKVVRWVTADAKAPLPETAATTAATLRVLTLRGEATYLDAAAARTAIQALGRLCIVSESAAVGAAAATAIVAAFSHTTTAVRQLSKAIAEKLAACDTARADLPDTLPTWLAAAAVFARDAAKHSAGVAEEVAATAEALLMGAVRLERKEDAVSVKSKKAPALTEAPSFAARVVEGAGEVLLAVLSAKPGAAAAAFAPQLFELFRSGFFAAYKLAAEAEGAGPASVGAVLKRLALNRLLLRLLRMQRAHSVEWDIGVAALLSAEESPFVRAELQRDIALAVQTQQAGMQHYALLFMSALAEETRGGYASLRSFTHHTAERLRELREQHNVAAAQPSALLYMSEYALPHLVLFLAHHSTYDTEAQERFIGFQRVFHAFFDEVFHGGLQGVSLIQELLRKLKHHDDGLSRELPNTRAMADLGLRVLYEVLAQRSVQADTVKPFPGQVLLPTCFLAPSSPPLFNGDDIFLDRSVVVSGQVQFRAQPPSASPAPTARKARRADSDDEDEEASEASDIFAASYETPSKKARGETPPPTSQRPRAASPSKSAAKTAAKAKPSPKASPKASPAPKADSKAGLQKPRNVALIEGAVARMYKGLSSDQIAALSIQESRRKVSEELGLEVNRHFEDALHDAMRAGYDAVVRAEARR